ncbi:LysR family transcriptional regulator [Roseibium sp. SCPC15]|uniref:LysR family transcriptional regulator n=1 Tax=Roseibium sp. SCP15 TaxID=3141376 RepID=UPI00333BF049
MRLPLATLEIFTAIAQYGSLKAAADALGLKPSTVSHQLKSLEERLGTALFIRTTRSINLTEAGRALLKGTAPAFHQISDAVESARATGHEPRGTLKLAIPEFAYHLLVAKTLPQFRAAYPEIDIELSLTDALEDILEAGMHAGIRLGDIVAQDMVAVRLSPRMKLAVVGAPDYFSRQGKPQLPEDLFSHECIRYRFHSSGRLAAWNFQGDDGDYVVEVSGKLIVNSLPVAVDAARRGEGLIFVLHDYVAQEIADGSLVPVLQEHQSHTPGFYFYFPREYRSMTALRLFLDLLRNSSETEGRGATERSSTVG